MHFPSSPPTSSTRSSSIVWPTSAGSRLTSMTSPGATLYCRPPVSMTAYTDDLHGISQPVSVLTQLKGRVLYHSEKPKADALAGLRPSFVSTCGTPHGGGEKRFWILAAGLRGPAH